MSVTLNPRFPVAYAASDDLSFTKNETQHGTNHTLRVGGQTLSVFHAGPIMKHEIIGPSANMLSAIFADATNNIQDRRADGYTGNALASVIETQVARIKPVFNDYVAKVKDVRSNHSVRKARVLEFNRNAEPNAHLRSDLRNWFLSHDPSKRIELALDADFELAAAIYEGGQRIAGLDDSIWIEFIDRYMALNHIRIAGLESAYALKPSPEFITNAGVDRDAVLDVARKAVKAFHYEVELLDMAEQYAKAIVAALVLLTGKPASEFIGA